MFLGIPGIVPLFMVLCTCFLGSCGLLEWLEKEGPGKAVSAFHIYFLDVGQGDATLMRTPGNRWFLFDTGNREEHLIPFLKNVRADTLAAVFISHPDLDHFGAFSALLRQIPVKKVFLPAAASANPAWLELLKDLDEYGGDLDTLFAGDTLMWDGVQARVVWPFPHTGLQGNDRSTVLRVEYLSSRILLTGDMEDPAERELLFSGSLLSADILKVAHHGSRTSSGLPLLSAVQPRWAIISCDSSAYGHPHAETIAGLKLVIGDEARILRTDREGTVAFELDAWGIRRVYGKAGN